MSPKQLKIAAAVAALFVLAHILIVVQLSAVSDTANRAEFRANQAESRAMNLENRLQSLQRDIRVLQARPH